MKSIDQLDLQYITNSKGEKTKVIMSIFDFEELLEDLQDLAVISERRDEPTVMHEELVKELKKDGLLRDNLEELGKKRAQKNQQRRHSQNIGSC